MNERTCGAHIDYPCPWVYKVIGRDVEGLRTAVAEILAERVHTVSLSRSSRGGTYHCLNVEITVESEAVRLDLYQRLCSHRGVMMVM